MPWKPCTGPRAGVVNAAALLIFAICGVASAAPTVTLREVALGFSSPLEVAHAHDGTGRLFVVEQGGRIRILQASPGSPPPGKR
jgi:hypothetical protein